MAESKIETFFSFGCLQGEILKKARRDERLRQPLEDDTHHHHEGYGMHPSDQGISIQHIAGCHAEGGYRHDKHPYRHGGKRCPFPHHPRDQIDCQNYD